MTFTLGRIPLANVGSWSPDLTGRIRVSGNINNNTAEINQHWASQLLELLDTGRRASIVLPLVWDENPSATGYYEVLGGSVVPLERIPIGWRYDLDLQKLPGGNTLPAIESILMGGYRPNQITVANTSHAEGVKGAGYLYPEWFLPSNAVELEDLNTLSLGSAANDARPVRGFKSGYWTRTLRWGIAAANFYTGACLIEQKIGATWLPVVGTQPVVTDTSLLRISNGYMGCTFLHPSTPGLLGFQFAGFGRTAGVLDWTTRGGFNTIFNGPSAVVNAITILRNDPEETRLRFSIGGLGSWAYYDLSLRRGLDYVSFGFPGGIGVGSIGLRMNATANVASTATTGGIYQTTASGGVQQWLMSTGGAAGVTNDLVLGSILPANNGGFVTYGAGPVYDSTVDTVTYTGTKSRWYAPLTERQRIVGR